MSQILAAIIAFCKSISALQWLAEALERWSNEQNKNTARDRLAEKDAAVDSGIDTISRLHTPEAEQQPKADEQAGLDERGSGSAGMVSRGPEDNQPP
jgi:hypothetical protein